jgi:hypothetical protein
VHWLAHILGLDDLSGPWYGWWSGAGSDVSELALFGALAASIRARNCEVKPCWRLGRHTTAAGHRVCRRHHPDDHLSAGQVIEQHTAALGGTNPQESP